MKIKTKLFFGVMTLIASANTFPVSAENYYDTIDYIECGDIAVITGFEGLPETISIPGVINGKTVVEIRENAFYKCESLKKIEIPETVTKIGHHAFYQCKSLETAEINGNISNLGEGSFYGCSSLKDIAFPDSLKFIGSYCFYGCDKIENITLPDELEEIGRYAFAGCGSLSSARLPEKLLNIGEFAFYQCVNLKSINVPDSVINMGNFSLGYFGTAPERIENFSISGGENSLGISYAKNNSLTFHNENKPKTNGNVPSAAIAAVIASAAGLMFSRILEKLKYFRRKYEYEC